MSFYGVLAALLLIGKFLAAIRYRKFVGPRYSGRVAVVIPVYNEDPELLIKCLRSLEAQTQRPDCVWIVDDGSSTPVTLPLTSLPVKFIRQDNAGKRHAQAHAFHGDRADVFVTIDSDTVLAPDAIEKLLLPFNRSDVTATTGYVSAYNSRRNLLTRLIDVRYANAFLFERAAGSVFGAMLCCCGSLSAYRRDVIIDNLDEYLNQTFLGGPVLAGDDRRLTNYAMQKGKTLLQSSARAYTAVPDRLSHFVRQQTRWNKSFFREAIYVFKTFSLRHPAWFLTAVEVATWITFTVALAWHALTKPVDALAVYASYLVAMSLARSWVYLRATHHSITYRITNVALSPLYGVLHILVLLPLRFYSLATLTRTGWGTRQRVEVAASNPEEVRP